jgi:hypothetical protein
MKYVSYITITLHFGRQLLQLIYHNREIRINYEILEISVWRLVCFKSVFQIIFDMKKFNRTSPEAFI